MLKARKSEVILAVIMLFVCAGIIVYSCVYSSKPIETVISYNTEKSSVTTTSVTKKSDFTGVVNINSATKSELMLLNGIGEKSADSIIKYRTENGKFDSIDEIMNVGGIGEKTFEQIKAHIKVK